MHRRILVLSGALLIVVFLTDAAAQNPAARNIDDEAVIEHVTLISPERPAPLSDVSVTVRVRKIAGIGQHVNAGEHSKRIDGREKFLIPRVNT